MFKVHQSPISAISLQLAALAKSELKKSWQPWLVQIVNRLFVDLAAGHSCSYVTTIASELQLKNSEVSKILVTSGLAIEYEQLPQHLAAYPLTILKNKSDSLIYISKYLAYELTIAKQVRQLKCSYDYFADPCFKDSFAVLEKLATKGGLPNSEQLAAIKNSTQQKFSIISGGPGTGKTTTIVLLLWLLYQLYGNELKVKICAPTGKAAIRVRDSINERVAKFQASPEDGIDCQLLLQQLLSGDKSFGTIHHKLLGFQTNSIYFRHNQQHTLDVDVLVIDESSMIGLPLFSKLLQAINPEKIKHIIFLGDKNQLSSVEEGYVFASMVNKAGERQPVKIDLFSELEKSSIVSELITSNRNQGEISDLATIILQQNLKAAKELFNSATQIKLAVPRLKVLMTHLFNRMLSPLLSYLDLCQELAKLAEITQSEIKTVFANFNRQSLLCLTNRGLLGSESLNVQIERRIRQHYQFAQNWYSGRAIIILQNDYNLELFNGDIGVCLIRDEQVMIVFENGREFIPEVLPAYQLAYAITIHKSQGSEYEQVNVVLAAATNDQSNVQSLLSRELVYTAITRAKQNVYIFSDEDVLLRAIGQQTLRNSGLGLFL